MKDKSLTKKAAKKFCVDAAKKQRLEHKKNLLKSLKMPQSTAKVSSSNNSNGDTNMSKENSSVAAVNVVSLNKANDITNVSASLVAAANTVSLNKANDIANVLARLVATACFHLEY